MAPAVYRVSELQRHVRELLESEFSGVWVEGEISNHRAYPSGHCYFTLKDEEAELKAVLWRSTAQRLRFDPEDGLAVRARGYLTVYERRGSYQMIVQALEPVGTGPLQVRFEQLRRRLGEEGLFDPDRKRPLPAWPRRAALITSPAGAAVRDLIHVARRRWPPLELVVVPCRVQGEGAAAEIAAAIRLADRRGFDVLVVGRGGGSLEDLWAFNEEEVARAIFTAKTPVVSAVGHEVDTTISDLVADLRAATPSAAAEAITPDAAELRPLLAGLRRRLARALEVKTDRLRRDLRHLAGARWIRRPLDFVHERGQRLDERVERLAAALSARLRSGHEKLGLCAARLEALSPLDVLARGYSVTLGPDGRVLRSARSSTPGDELRTLLAEGELVSRVERVSAPETGPERPPR